MAAGGFTCERVLVGAVNRSLPPLIPAKAGIQVKGKYFLESLGPRFRGDERFDAAGSSRAQIPAYQLKPRSLQ
jgi:hypothetical protein